MRNLILFLWKHNFFLLFLLLETLAVFLIVQQNYYHKNVFVHSANSVTGELYEFTHAIKGYFTLNRENAELAEENARLRSASRRAFMVTNMNSITREDTLYRRHLEYIPARVISGSVRRRSNNWMINKGSDQGLSTEMAVISPNGVVGIIVETSADFSLVYPLLHKSTHLSVKLKKNQHKGFITWPGGDYRTGVLNDIPAHVNVARGDTVVTSGNSMMFPENVLVGTVLDAKIEQGSSFYDIQIRFSEDYNRTEYVYVVKNIMKQEQEELLKKSEDASQ